ncbi:glycosyltransferase family 2 protein [Serendipita vermifera MAFF 305830]|uniref:chitin synthase n=1 Tax=Serendipita vermifera MAFF 305830 TaxID=933852 RepID=A0A0C3AQL7_SERVB|nr:glycosyltransferase family 2 protein [Serendipita vermifera MAFF 305830]
MSMSKEQKDPRSVHDLVSLITSTQSAATNPITIYPTDDTILSLLHARFRHDLPFTRLGATSLVCVNPNKLLPEESDAAMRDMAERAWDTSGRWRKEGIQASPYEFATRVYLAARRWNKPQVVVFRGTTSSGKSHTANLLTRQLLHLSSSPHFNHLSSSATRKAQKVASQITAFNTLLTAFGRAKTQANPDATRYSSYTELHFANSAGSSSTTAAPAGSIVGARVLAWGLDKSRLTRLRQDERTFHIFYQLLSGAPPELLDSLRLDDASDYALLASSSCYRLPSGPFSDDAAMFGVVEDAMRTLGFKERHSEGIWTLLSALLALGNIMFEEPLSARDEAAGYKGGANGLGGMVVDGQEEVRILNPGMLDRAARLLGVGSEDLKETLMTRLGYIKKEVVSTYLDAKNAARQRDRLVGGLYTLLFAYIVETGNHKLNPEHAVGDGPLATQVVLLDLPGFTTRANALGGLLSAASGGNGFTEFVNNFQDELLHSYTLRHAFEETLPGAEFLARDGIAVRDSVGIPSVLLDSRRVIGVLRGGIVTADEKSVMGKKVGGLLGVMGRAASGVRKGMKVEGDEFVKECVALAGGDASFVGPVVDPFASTPSIGGGGGGGDTGWGKSTNFGVVHYAGAVTYGVGANAYEEEWVERDADVWDPGFLRVLRNGESFVKRLVSGPGIAAEGHVKDPNVVVRAQISIRPLRLPSSFGLENEVEEEEDAEKAYSLDTTKAYPITTQLNAVLSSLLSRIERNALDIWTVHCIRPNDSGLSNSFDRKRARLQARSLGLVDLVGRRQHDWVRGYEYSEFLGLVGMGSYAGGPEDAIRTFASGERWKEGADYILGKSRIWLSWNAWRDLDDRQRVAEDAMRVASSRGHEEDDDGMTAEGGGGGPNSELHGWGKSVGHTGRKSMGSMMFGASQEDLLYAAGGLNSADPAGRFATTSTATGWGANRDWDKGTLEEGFSPPNGGGEPAVEMTTAKSKGGYSNIPAGDPNASTAQFIPTGDAKGGKAKGKPTSAPVEVIPTTKIRRWWVRFVWMCTWWIPSFLLNHIGGMKRSDIRMAWREKVTICLLIFSLCGSVIFYIIIFGKLICPDLDYAWNADELLGHSADNDFWVSISGSVYDITNFWKGDHSIPAQPMTPDLVRPYAGTDLSNYFPPPLELACAGLVASDRLEMRYANASTVPVPIYAVHTSGALQGTPGTDLNDPQWYINRFLPKMKEFYKGPLVWNWGKISREVNDNGRVLAVYADRIYDISDYVETLNQNNGGGGYDYIDKDVLAIFKQQAGQDITKQLDAVYSAMTDHAVKAHKACLNNRFMYGRTDYRLTPRCTVQGYLLIVASVIIALTILVKFLAALQLTSKRTPELLDKFIICQVPCYTEGEESLRRTIDSLAALKYDDKRKLLFIICDGNIVGSGNDRPTPRIVLDILGVDPGLDPEPLMFRSIGEGSKQLNYGKIYSGLYEFEGHVVPYMVVVKVGKPSERQRPGNRGKRDSQILLLHYLNRVHFDAPMYPLELEIYHQMRNIIGIDPAFYEYIFMVDADTSVTPDSLNRLVAVTSDDSSVIAVCGETKLDNEEGSWWTMIQVYEYYISHHLAKAFESLFGSVTCLPGCFSMYRIRTADKGRPLIISNRIIEEYSECNVDTLHKKNLLQLGEDRYLTTIMMKHFPLFKMKFTPDAIAHTVAPDRWSVLLSQRRRWINSTIHNLLELVSLGELCGFCCFSMRFVVFIDLLGTLILPATAVYLVYLIVVVSTGKAAIPIVSLAMIGAVYGLQAVIFLLKREFMLIGWMIIYILAYPVYSFFLPIYAFWSMDDFSWGNTRVVVGEGRDKKVVYNDDEGFDENVIPLKKFSDYEAEALELPEHRSVSGESRPGSRAHTPVAPGFQNQTRSRRGSQAASGYSGSNSPNPGGDYYQNTNLTYNNSSNPNLKLPPQAPLSTLNHSAHGGSVSGHMPQLPTMPFGGSDHGGMSMNEFGAMPGFGYAGSAYGGSAFGGAGPNVPRNSVMTNLNMFGHGGGMGSMSGMSNMGMGMGFGTMGSAAPPSAFPGGFSAQQRPMSSFSMATSVNPFMSAPSNNTNPTDEELLGVLRVYLSTQDLMTVTKKTAREAVMARFPAADLSSKKDFLNQSIERILSET